MEIFDIDRNSRNEENVSDDAENVSDDASVYSDRNFRRANLRVILTKETPSIADSNIEILDGDLRTSSVSSSLNLGIWINSYRCCYCLKLRRWLLLLL